MVFHADRVELCGVTVVSSARSSQMSAILEQLTVRQNEHRYKVLSGNTLAKAVGTDGGQGSIAGSVRDFRRQVAEVLGREAGLKVERDDVIETSKVGYRLNGRIVVNNHRNTGSRLAAETHACTGDDLAEERRKQILALVRSGERLRLPEIAKKLNCSFTTVKREVDALKGEGHIEFVGPAKTGYCKLVAMARA